MNSPNWTLRVAHDALKSLRRAPARDRVAIVAKLDHLARDPLARHLDTVRLKGHLFGWRLRIRDYRILYDLEPLTRTIDVGRIERRTSSTY